jgi:hypothetical protein
MQNFFQDVNAGIPVIGPVILLSQNIQHALPAAKYPMLRCCKIGQVSGFA